MLEWSDSLHIGGINSWIVVHLHFNFKKVIIVCETLMNEGCFPQNVRLSKSFEFHCSEPDSATISMW